MSSDKKPTLSWSTPAQAQGPKPPASTNQAPLKALPAAPKSNMPAYAGIFVGGIVLGVVLAWGWSAIHSGSTVATKTTDKEVATTSGTSATTNTDESNGALVVHSPQVAGQSVSIADVEVQSPTWVVVYEDNNGTPGNALGAQLFFTSGAGVVTLLRATEVGQSYLVGTSVDNGDHRYSKASDKPTTNADGSLATVTITAN